MPVDIKLARERWKQGEDADSAQAKRELADIRFYNGEQWDQDILRSRQGLTLGSGVNQQVVPARPTITINKCLEPVRQILNQERQSDLTVELIPADDFGESQGPIDYTEIQLREGLVRRIQRDSEASDARTWAFNRATIAGRGYWTVNTRYVPGKSMDQEVYIERLYNQASVIIDPAHTQPDGSDAEWGFIGTDVPIAVYEATYPHRKKKKVSSQATDEEWRALGDEAPNWFTGTGDTRSVRVVRYYYVKHDPRELVQLADGRVAWRDELPEDVPKDAIKSSRSVDTKLWQWADIDGIQELDGDEWQGHYLPIVKVLGEELQPYDNERRSQGVVRPMRSPCEGFNYVASKYVEYQGLQPIPPWMGPAGFDEGFENEYDAANTRALSRLHYNSKDFNGNPIPPGAVMRTPMTGDVQGLAFGMQMFGQAIASTSVVPETALGNVDPSVKSGKLAKALIQQAEQGTSNFMDNLKRSMRHEARIVNDLLYPIYGTRPGRLARMMSPNGEMSAVVIGQPFMVQGQGPQARPQPLPPQQPGQPLPQGAKEFKLTPDAEFNVAIKISKNEGTRRQQQEDLLVQFVSADPTQMQVMGDLLFKYSDMPGHEELEKRYQAVLIPPVQAIVSGKPSIPPELQQQMQQMQEAMKQLQQDADKNKAMLAGKQMDNASKERITSMELQAKERLALVQQLAALAAVDAKVDAENARSEVDAAIARVDKELDIRKQAVDKLHDAMGQQADQQHQVVTQAIEHAHEVNMAHLQQDHELEQGQQAAALTPEPAPAGQGA